ncbi:Puff-specific protein Bx42 [Nowakowskiella sp. JEL0078]|nr:Puff-specific protein Bx42 [Nowakowskiella sp. JEL0078]
MSLSSTNELVYKFKAPSTQLQLPSDSALIISNSIPGYGKRSTFVPRTLEDFGDGGAYPEIRMPQYPLDMGRKKSNAGNLSASNVASSLTNSGTLTLQTDADGTVKYDMLVKQHAREGQMIQTKFEDLVPMSIGDEEDDRWKRPGPDIEKETMEKTVQALEKIVDTKIKASQPKQVVQRTASSAPQFIKYTPQSSLGSSTGTSSRIIRMVEAPIDPFEPPRFKFKKVPPSAPEAPAPVLHSPSRKVTAEEQKNWVIPPCISNWKNAKGFTIPLDKRLAADGRGVQEIQINDKFASLSEAMYIAEGYAREQVRLRNEMQSKVAGKKKKEKEEELRRKAQAARDMRSGFATTSLNPNQAPVGDRHLRTSVNDNTHSDSEESEATESAIPQRRRDDNDESLTEEERARVKERNEVRRERERQRIRELRMSHMGAETLQKVLSKSSTERDVSEKIALGLAKPTLSKDALFDQRLFNQSAGMSSGFGAEDSYNLYDKPLFNASSANAIYRPKKTENEAVVQGVDAERIGNMLGDADPSVDMSSRLKGFQGASEQQKRDGPVMFEKDEDVFGLEQFLSDAKKGREAKDLATREKNREAAEEDGDRDHKRRRH